MGERPKRCRQSPAAALLPSANRGGTVVAGCGGGRSEQRRAAGRHSALQDAGAGHNGGLQADVATGNRSGAPQLRACWDTHGRTRPRVRIAIDSRRRPVAVAIAAAPPAASACRRSAKDHECQNRTQLGVTPRRLSRSHHYQRLQTVRRKQPRGPQTRRRQHAASSTGLASVSDARTSDEIPYIAACT